MAGDVERREFMRAYRFRLYPTDDQARQMDSTMSCCRVVYNHFLHERIASWERTQQTLRRPAVADGETDERGREIWLRDEDGRVVYQDVPNDEYDPEAKPMSYYDTTKALTSWKAEVTDEDGHRWLADADSVALVYSLRNLDNAYKQFFRGLRSGRRVGFPRFKPKGSVREYTTKCKPEWVERDDGCPRRSRIKLPKVGWVRMVAHRPVDGVPYAVTVRHGPDGRWFASIACREVAIEPLERRDDMVGIATGVSPWVVTSDGEVFDNKRRARKMEKRLAREQRRLSRKQGARKGEERSANYRKQALKVARLRARVADQRRDDTNKLTRQLVDEHGVIVSREMRVQDMMDKDGHGAAGNLPAVAKRSLNASLADASLSEINRQLAYKSQWAGRGFVLVPNDYPTAQTCSACGYKDVTVAGDLRPAWTCPKCGARHDRKLNGSVNVLEAGMDYLAGSADHAVSKNVVRRDE